MNFLRQYKILKVKSFHMNTYKIESIYTNSLSDTPSGYRLHETMRNMIKKISFTIKKPITLTY